MTNFFLLVLIAVFVLLTIFAYSRYTQMQDEDRIVTPKKKSVSSPDKKEQSATKYCLLCGALLLPGQNIVSRIYGPLSENTGQEQSCHVYGCPNCYKPQNKSPRKRKCPVCGKTIPAQGYLIAKIAMQSSGRRHVRVTGCTECHKKG